MTEALTTETVPVQDCDREPIHIPEAIQPHGFLLVIDADSGAIVRGAGDIADLTGFHDWTRRPLVDLIGPAVAGAALAVRAPSATWLGRWRRGGMEYDVSGFAVNDRIVIEVEQATGAHVTAAERLGQLDQAALGFERAGTLQELYDAAAEAFRGLTGFDRVMISRFLEDDTGCVLAESRADGMDSFLNQHFPATDIPKQARALYIRNVVRVIPDSQYTPRPLLPAGPAPLDMSESALRSVSPVHLQYLRNMGVRASASVSIVIGGRLWGLIACHNNTPLLLPREQRSASAVLARGLARQIKGRLDADVLRSRLQARALEEEIVAGLELDLSLTEALGGHMGQLQALMDSDGFAVVADDRVLSSGSCPSTEAIRTLADWVTGRPTSAPVITRSLPGLLPEAEAWGPLATGLIGFHVPEADAVLLWFRAEHLETVRWAGDPHGGVKKGPQETLTPRASFDAWAETVSGQAIPWTSAQMESAARFRDALVDFGEVTALRSLKSRLEAGIADRDHQLSRQGFLMREVSHRVQNSLQLISSFLALQARDSESEETRNVLEEARRRIKAVSLVHRRLYRAEQGQTIELERYLADLVEDLIQSMGEDWRDHVSLELDSVVIEPERAITLGLILTELVINVQKYGYAGQPGPLTVRLESLGGRFRLLVADQGAGGYAPGKGFGSRMMDMLAAQLGGEIALRPEPGGLSVELIAPAQLDSRG